MSKAKDQNMMNIYNQGKGVIQVKNGIDQKDYDFNPKTSLKVSVQQGKKLVAAYPRQIVDAAKIAGTPDFQKRVEDLEAREKIIAKKEKALKEAQENNLQKGKHDENL